MKHFRKSLLGVTVFALFVCSCKTGVQYSSFRPENRKPNMVRPARSYTIADERSFPGYTNVQQADDNTSHGDYYPITGIWRTSEATYVAYCWVPQENWWWIRFNSETYLRDCDTGDCYKLRYVEHFPTDTCFFVGDQARQILRFIQVFPPLPDKVKTVDYISRTGDTRENMNVYPPVLGIDLKVLAGQSVKKKQGKVIY